MPFDETLKRALDELARTVTSAVDAERAEAADRAAAEARDAAKHDIAVAEAGAFDRGRSEGRQLGIDEGRRLGFEDGLERGAQDARAQAKRDADARRAADLGTSQRLADALRAIDRGRSLSEILDTLAGCAGRETARAAVLLVRGEQVVGWRFIGFGPALDGRTDFELPLAESGIIGEAVAEGGVAAADSAAPGTAPSFAPLPPGRELLAVPISLNGHVVAVLYGDQGPDEGREARFAWPATLEVMARYAAHCLEAMTAFRAAQLAVQSPTHPHAQSQTEAESARRYARLLVSEIKLYHEPEVAAGRRERDLAVRLGGEIARARALYEQRVPRETRAAADFFHQELVRTLADGDEALLKS
jgi:hypothetical protein